MAALTNEELTEALDALTTRVLTLEKGVANCITVTQMNSYNLVLQTEINDLKSEITSLKSRVSTLESNLNEIT